MGEIGSPRKRARWSGGALWVSTWLLVPGALATGCAHAPAPRAADDSKPELERLRIMLVEREQTIDQLHGKIALLEAGQRSLADQLATREELRCTPVREESTPEVAVRAPSRPEPRPVLRLHGDASDISVARQRSVALEFTSSWQPPSTTERLAVAPLPALGSTAPPEPMVEDGDAAAEALYVQALDLVRKRDFGGALRELDGFLRAFPADRRAGRVLFWRGEVLFAQREYARALASFEEALQRDPRSEKAAETLLRVARCQLRLGAAERARSTIAELRNRFPESDAARAAAQLEQEDT